MNILIIMFFLLCLCFIDAFLAFKIKEIEYNVDKILDKLREELQ